LLHAVTAVLEEENAADDTEVVKKARNYYKTCLNEGEINSEF